MDGRRWGINALFFASGASGLVYEVVWVREFGFLFGSTVYSAALVTGIFMLGLGLGGWAVGRWADRRFPTDPDAPLRAYGAFELAIAACAALVIVALPWVAELSARASHYVPGPHGWLVLGPGAAIARYGLAAALITPITFLMGGTLTLLIRAVVAGDLAGVGSRVGWLYGVNTAGAALGCLATDAVLVPALGLAATQGLAIATNLAVAGGALALAGRARAGAIAPPGRTRRARDPLDARAWGMTAAVACGGFAAMAMQIVWFRHLISIFGGTRAVFSILLGAILCGTWIGAIGAGELERRLRRAPALYAAGVVAFALTAAAALLRLQAGPAADGPVSFAAGRLAIYGELLRTASWAVGIPACFAGAAFPLANAIVQRHRERVGESAGLLYLGNTAGAVLGAWAAGFWLLPSFGVQATVGWVLAGAGLSVIALAAAVRDEWRSAPQRRAIAACAAALLLGAAAWTRLPEQELVRRSLPESLRSGVSRVLAVREGINETIAVSERRGLWLELVTNGYNMSATTLAAQRYMRAFVHVPALIGEVETALVMGFGVGNTASAALLHPGLRRLDVVDLSPDVLEQSRFFAAVHGDVLDDPRVRVFVNDARHHLRMSDGPDYDLITGEPPPLHHAGVVNLYTREFFALAAARLRPGGMVSYWLPVAQIGEGVARAIVRAFVDVFPGAVLLSGHGQHLILLGRQEGELSLELAAVAERTARARGVRRDLEAISLASAAEWANLFLAGPAELEAATAGVAPLRDDHPILEYGDRSFGAGVPRPSLFPLPEVSAWCADCAALDGPTRREIAAHRSVLARFFASGAFLGDGARFGGEPLPPAAEEAVARSFHLQLLLDRAPGLQRIARTASRHGRPGEAARALRELIEREPGNALARLDLAAVYRDAGQLGRARAQLRAVLAGEPGHAGARAAWAELAARDGGEGRP